TKSQNILLMDEPCSALDRTSTRRVEETIQELAGQVTGVIVTHTMQQAARVCQQCAFFLAEQGTPGGIVGPGPTDELFGTAVRHPEGPADRGLRGGALRLSLPGPTQPDQEFDGPK